MSDLISIKDIFNNEQLLNTEIKIGGWLRTVRSSKKVTFLQLSDGSCFSNLQLVIDNDLTWFAKIAPLLLTGTAIVAIGTLVKSTGAGQSLELIVKEIEIIGECDDTYPLQKKGHSLEFLREILHLRPRTNTFGAIARIRSECAFAVHEFFRNKNFFYIHTPIITASDCEGAGELFQVKRAEENNPSAHFFGRPAFLSVSGQLQVECYAEALSKVYTFGPTFRAENSQTTRHLAEFWMIEPEMAFYDLNDNLNLAFSFIRYLVEQLLTRCKEDLAFLHSREWVSDGLLKALEQILVQDIEIIEYTEAIATLQNCEQKFTYPVIWGNDLQTEHERYLTEKLFIGPVGVINYPRSLKPFYMRVNDDGKTVAAMDILLPGVGEIIGGSQREERSEILISRLKETGIEDLLPYQWYLDLRKYGTVPHSGFGLGFERILMYVTGITNIRDVIPFPRTPSQAAC
jgi:asparaginyl-tRNA synthetase